MHTLISFFLICFGFCNIAWAQTQDASPPTEATTTSATATANATASATANSSTEKQTQHIRIEDKGSRIDETRHRGQTTRTEIQPSGARAYEITPNEGAHSAPTASPGASTNEGKRVWKVMDF